MKELDVLLERFVRDRYAAASPGGQQAFRRLLELPDPVLAELLLGPPDTPGAPDTPDTNPGPDPAHDPELAEIVALVAGRR